MLIDLSNDIQLPNGDWVRSVTVGGKSEYTKVGILYEGMLTRCNQSGYIVKLKPAYLGCYHTFTGFQDFAKWATQQIGYGLEDYELDKDLLQPNCKVYSKDTCCFLPAKINSGLVTRKSRRSKHGLGVQFKNGKYNAKITINSKKVWLGTFDDSKTAFEAYKKAKEANLKSIAEQYREVIDPRAYAALVSYEVLND